jgi:hypothetical protein
MDPAQIKAIKKEIEDRELVMEDPFPMRETILDAARQGTLHDIEYACKDNGIPYQKFGFVGVCQGVADGVPCRYTTKEDESTTSFLHSTKNVGETLDYEGEEWVVVWNVYNPKKDGLYDGHSFVIVPVAALR